MPHLHSVVSLWNDLEPKHFTSLVGVSLLIFGIFLFCFVLRCHLEDR